MTSQQALICDNSTLANFIAWAQAISNQFAAAGWTKAPDTGQVNWTTIAAVPGSGVTVYEMWNPPTTLGLTSFFLKVEYGNFSGQANCPTIRWTMSTSTNGAGVCNGFVAGPVQTTNGTYAAPSSTTPYQCYFSYAPGRFSLMMWRDSGFPCFIGIERSRDANGNYTGQYATIWAAGPTSFNAPGSQISLVFSVGVPPAYINGTNTTLGGWCVRVLNANQSSAWNGGIPCDLCAPCVGYFDYACSIVGAAYGADLAEGVPFTMSVKGTTMTFLPSKSGYFPKMAAPNSNVNSGYGILLMRYE